MYCDLNNRLKLCYSGHGLNNGLVKLCNSNGSVIQRAVIWILTVMTYPFIDKGPYLAKIWFGGKGQNLHPLKITNLLDQYSNIESCLLAEWPGI